MQSDPTTNPYLQQEVLTVTPIRLRWMLVNRAEELCVLVEKLWKEDKRSESLQWLLRIREILCELLDGVVDRENPVSQSVCDFYLFLIKLMNDIDRNHSPRQLQMLRELLAIEAETWRMAVEKFESENSHAEKLELAPPPRAKQPLPLPPTAAMQAFVDTPHATSGFSLEI
jgi:flagellar secretion chaperone FliS